MLNNQLSLPLIQCPPLATFCRDGIQEITRLLCAEETKILPAPPYRFAQSTARRLPSFKMPLSLPKRSSNLDTPGQASLLPALSPSYVNNEVINYSSSDGLELYNASIAPLPIKEFEGNGGNT